MTIRTRESVMSVAVLAMLVSACEGAGPASPAVLHAIATASAPPDGGTATGGGRIPEKEPVTVVATPNAGFEFERWTEGGATVSDASEYLFVVLGDRQLVANFVPIYSVTTAPVPTNGGVSSGDGEFREGSTVSLTAMPNAGYQFDEWKEGGVAVSDEATFAFVAAADRTLTAHFVVDQSLGGWSPGGTYSDWFFPAGGYQSLEWTFVPVADPPQSLTDEGLLHYYAYTFAVANASPDVGGGYAGFQTNGIILGAFRGKVVNYSIWGSNGGNSDGWVNPGNTESGGHQIMYPYEWEEGGAYRFGLREGPSGIDADGKWWGLWVTDLGTSVTTFLGEQRVPAIIGGMDASLMNGHTAMFGEDLHWWRSLTGTVPYICSDFEPSAMAAVDVTANGGSVQPERVTSFTNSGWPSVGSNGYETANCHVTMYTNEEGDVQHSIGFWPEAAPNGVAGR